MLRFFLLYNRSVLQMNGAIECHNLQEELARQRTAESSENKSLQSGRLEGWAGAGKVGLPIQSQMLLPQKHPPPALFLKSIAPAYLPLHPHSSGGAILLVVLWAASGWIRGGWCRCEWSRYWCPVCSAIYGTLSQARNTVAWGPYPKQPNDAPGSKLSNRSNSPRKPPPAFGACLPGCCWMSR